MNFKAPPSLDCSEDFLENWSANFLLAQASVDSEKYNQAGPLFKTLNLTNLFSHSLAHVNPFLTHSSNNAVFSVSADWGIDLLWFWFTLGSYKLPRKGQAAQIRSPGERESY